MTLLGSITDGGTDEITVLHVDDEQDLADLTTTYLEREDDLISAQTATSADEGLEVLAEHEIDCVVSDFDMPGTNGIEFLESVRDDHPELPFILYTGKGSEEVASEAISAGVSDYLQKENGTDHYAVLANRIRNYVERARAERDQNAIRERMQLALEKTDSVIFEINRDTGVVTRHGAFEQFFDHSADSLPTWEDHLEHAVHPADRDAFQQFYQQLADGEREAGTLEYRTTLESGDLRWIRDNVHLDGHNPRHAIGIAQDVTAQKEQERQRQQIIERVTDAIVEVDSEWEFTLVNEQAEELYDMDEADLLGRDFWDVFHEAIGTRFEEEYRQVMQTREPTSFVECFSQLDGWFDITAYPEDDGGIAFYFVEVTEQRQRQHELEQSNALLSTLFDTLPVGMIAEDAERNVLATNERMFDLFDLPGTPEDAVGADCTALAEQVSEQFVDSERFVEQINELGETRKPTDNERLTLRDGRTFERSHRGIDLPSGSGDLWVYHDMTEQEKREQQLREEQQFVKSIFNALPDPLYAFDTEGYPIRWNEQLETVTGYSGDEIEEMHFTDFIPDDEVDDVATHFQTIIEDRQPVTVESTVETKHGERIPFEYSGAPLEGSDGDLRGVTGIGRDISDRKEQAERLRSLNERSQDLIAADTREQIVDIGVDAAHDILGLTANAIHLYDEDRAGLVPMATTDAVTDLIGEPPVFTEGDSIAWRAYTDGEVFSLDRLKDDPDVYNPETPLESELYLPLGDHGILIAGSPTSEAFDQQDIVLGEIWAANITTALDQIEHTEDLRAREQELTRQNERLEEFASIVSHDLRNPLSVADGRLELAREECDSDHLDAIARALDRMDALIEDMLTLARDNDARAEFETVDIATLAHECWQNVPAAEAEFSTEIDMEVRADRSRLQQLFENLMRNANEHGGKDVTVTVGEIDGGFYVEDTGPGIPPDIRDQVFDAGYSTAESGTGFGLNIVKQVADDHGWQVRVADGTAGGTRIEITGVDRI